MKVWKWVGGGLATVLLTSTALTPSQAQDAYSDPGLEATDRLVTVRTRARPDYDPIGIRAGGFLIFPEVTLQEIYDDNIFRTENDEEEDFITVVSPDVAIRSNWNNHELNLASGADIGFYADNTDEDYEDFYGLADGRVDITRETRLFGLARFDHLHQDRGFPTQQGLEPIEYDRYGFATAADHEGGRIHLNGGVDVTWFDFEDVPARGGGEVNQDDRDRTEIDATGQIGYKFLADYEVFARGGYVDRSYDDSVDDLGFRRDNDGYFAGGGIELELTGTVFAEVFVGYGEHQFDDDPNLPDVNTVLVDGQLVWNITQLTTLAGAFQRSIEETTIPNASAFIDSTIGLRADHELRRNVLLNVSVEYENNDYEGISRDDDYLRAGIGGEYLFNRHFRAGARYRFENRNSSAPGEDFSDNLFQVYGRAAF